MTQHQLLNPSSKAQTIQESAAADSVMPANALLHSSQAIEYFPRFSFSMPFSSAEALWLSRFEEGDVFYNSPLAYTDWGAWKASKNPYPVAIQVRKPRRETFLGLGGLDNNLDEKETVFSYNWKSAVELEYHDFVHPRRILTSSQGGLLYCLWKGDVAYLDEKNSPDPPPLPARLPEVLKRIAEIITDAAVANDIESNDSVASLSNPASRNDGSSIVLSVCDLAQENSRELSRWLWDFMARYEPCEPYNLDRLLRDPSGLKASTKEAIARLEQESHPAIYFCAYRLRIDAQFESALAESFSRQFPGKAYKSTLEGIRKIFPPERTSAVGKVKTSQSKIPQSPVAGQSDKSEDSQVLFNQSDQELKKSEITLELTNKSDQDSTKPQGQPDTQAAKPKPALVSEKKNKATKSAKPKPEKTSAKPKSAKPKPAKPKPAKPKSAKPKPAKTSAKPKSAKTSARPKSAKASAKPKPAPVSEKKNKAAKSAKPKSALVSEKKKKTTKSAKPKPEKTLAKPKPAKTSSNNQTKLL